MPITVAITCATPDEAKKIARALVEEQLVAGANLLPAFSIYRWRGKVREAEETLILAQSRQELFEELCERVRQLHSYECPCLEAWPLPLLSPDFQAWIEDSCPLNKGDI